MKIFGFIAQSVILVLVLASCNSSNKKHTSNINDLIEILSIIFSRSAIENVLSKQ